MKILAAIAILVLALPVLAESYIGLFADEYGDRCWANIEPFVEVRIHILVFLDSGDLSGGLTAAEFRLENWPGDPGYPLGDTSIEWSSDLVLGQIDENLTIAFSSPQPGPVVKLAGITLQMYSNDWMEEGYRILVDEGLEDGLCAVVNDMFEIFDATGMQFTFNCDPPCSCRPGYNPADSNWSEVKNLY